jgi:AmpD protein
MIPAMPSVNDQHWLRGARHCVSPNANERPDRDDVSLIVVHGISLPPGEFGTGCIEALFTNTLATNTLATNTLATNTLAERPDADADAWRADLVGVRVSSHLLVNRRGAVTQFVPFDRRAWHAGVSSYQGRSGCNDFSIGIELEGTDRTPYAPAQYRRLAAIIATLIGRYPRLGLGSVVGHAEIAPGRKTDPGPAFDWPRLYRLLAP